MPFKSAFNPLIRLATPQTSKTSFGLLELYVVVVSDGSIFQSSAVIKSERHQPAQWIYADSRLLFRQTSAPPGLRSSHANRNRLVDRLSQVMEWQFVPNSLDLNMISQLLCWSIEDPGFQSENEQTQRWLIDGSNAKFLIFGQTHFRSNFEICNFMSWHWVPKIKAALSCFAMFWVLIIVFQEFPKENLTINTVPSSSSGKNSPATQSRWFNSIRWDSLVTLNHMMLHYKPSGPKNAWEPQFGSPPFGSLHQHEMSKWVKNWRRKTVGTNIATWPKTPFSSVLFKYKSTAGIFKHH